MGNECTNQVTTLIQPTKCNTKQVTGRKIMTEVDEGDMHTFM